MAKSVLTHAVAVLKTRTSSQSQLKVLALMHSIKKAFIVRAAASLRSQADGARLIDTLLLSLV